jgi:hypothetical protein
MAKSNRTINFLNDNISEDYSWRIKELINYKSILKESNSFQMKSLLRGGIVLLYAHWEGFVKQATSHYYNFVLLQRHNLKDLSESFIAFSLRKYLDIIISSNKITIQTEGIKFILNNLEDRANLPSNFPFKTSNLDYKKFLEFCQILSLDITRFELKKNFIDFKLVKNRHEIAHGSFLPIDLKTFEEIFDKTIELINDVKIEVLNSASLQKFLRNGD